MAQKGGEVTRNGSGSLPRMIAMPAAMRLERKKFQDRLHFSETGSRFSGDVRTFRLA